MPTTHFECNECEAVFAVKHSLDKHYYTVQNCPFCGASLDDENYDVDDAIDE
jgi:transcription elongation factor Elf1